MSPKRKTYNAYLYVRIYLRLAQFIYNGYTHAQTYTYINVYLRASMHEHMHAVMYKCIHLHATMYEHMHAIMHICIHYACTLNGVQGYITIITPTPFYSAAWKSEIPTLPCCVLKSAR